LSGKLLMFTVPLLVAQATAARAQNENGGNEAAPEAAPAASQPATSETAPDAPRGDDTLPARSADAYYPPSVEGPALRVPESPTRIYLDGAYAISNDLTALPYIAGRGRNVRVALGGAWRWRRFTFDAALPAHLTKLDVTSVLNQAPLPEDAHQTKISLGDLSLGAVWTERLAGDSEAVIGGLGLRGRLATHTTGFEFHLNDGSIADFVIPYYFHVEPTLILGGALGPFTYVVNQGAIMLWGPDANFDTEHITVPTIYLYDGHYAIGVAPWSFLGASVELATMIQLNHISGTDFQKFNDIRAVWVAPALQVHIGDVRVDLIARLGLSRGQELYGVLEYVGTHSFTLRVTKMFN
jgi:hypothetical protein